MNFSIETGATLISELERRFREQPTRVAIEHGSRKWTYGQLERRVGEIAAGLLERQVAPASHVGVHLQPSAELIATLFAILKIGAAYVPIDSSSPEDRLRFIATDANLHCIVTDRAQLQGNNIVQIGDLQSRIQDRRATPDFPVINCNADAYVIYTSGSTGKPKGVICTHFNVLRLLASTERWFSFSTADRWTLFHSVAFDFSVWEIFGALLYGGTLVIVPSELARDTVRFSKLLIDDHITVLNQTPSALYNLINVAESLGTDCFSGLRVVILGGEKLQLSKLQQWFKRGAHHPRLINMYGITETTVHVTYREISAEDVSSMPGLSPIGVPIPDLAVYLLNDNLEQVLHGEIGEICIAGAGVARGYLNRPELTAKRFIRCPVVDPAQPYLYRSGDLGWRTSTGELCYLGRADRQVKIRGYRIELGEIETALLSLNGVAAVCVTTLASENDTQLIAHVIPDAKLCPGAYLEASLRYRSEAQFLHLDGGIEVACVSESDALAEYEKIFRACFYERLGVRLYDDACVIDMGAGIGVFCLFILKKARKSRIIATEPNPKRAEALGVNLIRYGANGSVRGFESLSGLIDQEGLTRVDLLKINGDKYNLELLEGVREEHWVSIKQVVVESPTIGNSLERARAVLLKNGYECLCESDVQSSGQARCYLYVRSESSATTRVCSTADTTLESQYCSLITGLRRSLEELLPGYMIPAQFSLLPEIPLTINGKVDEQKLVGLLTNQQKRSRVASDLIEQKVFDIWRDVLRREDIDVELGLVALGAHSLAIVEVAVRLYDAFGLEISIDELRESASIASIAKKLRGRPDSMAPAQDASVLQIEG